MYIEECPDVFKDYSAPEKFRYKKVSDKFKYLYDSEAIFKQAVTQDWNGFEQLLKVCLTHQTDIKYKNYASGNLDDEGDYVPE